MRTASAAAKPCQGESSEFYLITGFLTVVAVSRGQVKGLYHMIILETTYINDKVLKLKNIKKDGYTRLQHQEQYEHVGLEVTRSQEGKRKQDNDKRLYLVDDLKEVLNHIHIKSKPKVNDHYINSQVKD
ncbi:hypothetical protein Tco_0085588 [Tanacetum coccineum]